MATTAATTASRWPVAGTRSITPDAATTSGASFHHVIAGTTAPTSTRSGTWAQGSVYGTRVPTPLVPGIPRAPTGTGTTSGTYTGGSGTITRYPTPTPPPVYGSSGGGTIATPAQTQQGGTVGGFNNALSGDLLGRLGLTLPKALEIVALLLAGWLAWKYLARKAGGRRR